MNQPLTSLATEQSSYCVRNHGQSNELNIWHGGFRASSIRIAVKYNDYYGPCELYTKLLHDQSE